MSEVRGGSAPHSWKASQQDLRRAISRCNARGFEVHPAPHCRLALSAPHRALRAVELQCVCAATGVARPHGEATQTGTASLRVRLRLERAEDSEHDIVGIEPCQDAHEVARDRKDFGVDRGLHAREEGIGYGFGGRYGDVGIGED